MRTVAWCEGSCSTKTNAGSPDLPRTPAQAIAFLVGLWLAFWLLVPLWAAPAAADTEAAASPFATLEGDLFRAVNTTRVSRHLVGLRRDPGLDRVARAHSRDMARRGYFSHTTPEGLNPVDRLSRGGVTGFALAAENVGMTDRPDPNREIHDGWLASPVHRKNLLAPAFNVTGIGVAAAADGTLYYTQLYTSVPRP